MRKIFSLFSLSYKKILANIPAILAGTLIVALTSLLLIVGFYNYASDNSSEVISANVGLVKDDKSSYADMALDYLSSSSSIRDIVKFVLYDSEDEAMEAIQDHKVIAYAYMPEDFISSVLNGSNRPLKVIVGDLLPNTGAGYFFDILDSSAEDIGISQAAIYSVERLARENDLSASERDTILSQINNVYISSFISRELMFDTSYLNSGNGLSLSQFYMCTFVLLIVMLSGISFISVLSQYSSSILATMRRSGLPLINSITVYLSCSFIFSILFFIVLSIATHTIINIFILIIIFYSIFAFNGLIYRLVKEETIAMLLVCLFTFVLLYLSGSITQISYLSDLLIDCGRSTHIGSAAINLRSLISGATNTTSIVLSIVYSLIFTVASVLLDYREANKS